MESNGIQANYSNCIWPLEQIVATNHAFRQNADFKDLYMPFDALLFFSDAGNGDQFAFLILNGEIRKHDIFVWNHEDDSRMWIAPNLSKFIETYVKGELKV